MAGRTIMNDVINNYQGGTPKEHQLFLNGVIDKPQTGDRVQLKSNPVPGVDYGDSPPPSHQWYEYHPDNGWMMVFPQAPTSQNAPPKQGWSEILETA